MLANLQILIVYTAAAIVLFVSWMLRAIKMKAKSSSALVGWLTLEWFFSWLLGMLVWLMATSITGIATFPAPIHVVVFLLGVAALFGALLLVVGEVIRTGRVVARGIMRTDLLHDEMT